MEVIICGLVGVAGGLVKKDEELMKKLLLWDWLRGQDATGLASIRNNGEVYIAKMADHPLALFESRRFTDALNGLQSTVFIGHNRAKTIGKNNDYNAHPFEEGDIVGAHNGTLTWSTQDDLESALGQKYDVDSQALFAHINRFGLKETISKLQGAWSIVYYDKKDDSLNFIRNKERPMWYAWSKKYNRLFWASDYEFIRSAIALTAPKDPDYELWTDKKGVGYFVTDIDTHYKFDVEALRKGGDRMPKPKTRKMEGKKVEPRPQGGGSGTSFFPSHQTGNTGGNIGTHSQDRGTGTGLRRTNSTTRCSTSTCREDKIEVVGAPTKPFGDWYKQEEFEQRTKYGCTWCGNPVEFTVPGIIIYERENSVLCPTCSHKPRRNTVVTKALYLS